VWRLHASAMIASQAMPPAARRLGVVVAAMLVLLSPLPRAAALQKGAFERYAHGDFAVIESLTLDGFDAIRREVKASALSPQIKAAFLLEAFETFQRRLQLDSRPGPAVGPYDHLDQSLRNASSHVFENAYDAMAAVPAADESVANWFRAAAAAYAHGAYGQSQVDEWYGRWGDIASHVSNDRRFDGHVDPGEGALTRALELERFAWRSVYQDRRTYVVAEQDAFGKWVEKTNLVWFLAAEKDAVPRALVELKKAEAFESARPESLMRQGALVAASGHPEQAMPLFEESERLTHDDWVAYLDHLLEGRALESMDRVDAAEAAYRAALALRPKARSANLALAALLFAHGARADTNLLAVFDPASDRLDPWAQFTFGAYRFWPERRDAMRRSLK